jgi:hypothetical protein
LVSFFSLLFSDVGEEYCGPINSNTKIAEKGVQVQDVVTERNNATTAKIWKPLKIKEICGIMFIICVIKRSFSGL